MAFAKLPNGINLYYEVAGEGPPLILLHGWGFSGAVWRPIVEQLKVTHTLYILDLRGHGRSEKPEADYSLEVLAEDLRQFLDFLGLPKVTLIGWSMGGMIGIYFAAHYPQRVEKLGLISSTSKLIQAEDFPYGAPPPIVRRLDKQLTQNFDKAMEAFSRLIIYGEDHLKEKRAELWAQMEDGVIAPPPHVARACLHTIETADLRGDLDKISMPTVIIHGALDHICPVGTAYFLNAHIPNSMLHIFPTAAHAPHLTHAEQVGTRLSQFLRGDVPETP